MATVKFYAGTLSNYNALSAKDDNTLYFITDAGKIYKGATNVTDDISVVSSVPTSLYEGKIAIYPQTANGNTVYAVYAGNSSNAAVLVSPGTISDASAFDDTDVNGGYTATVAAIADYVNNQISAVTGGTNNAFDTASYSTSSGTITLTDIAGDSTNLTLTGVAHDVTYDSTNLTLTIPEYGKSSVVINLPKDFFVQSGEYVESYSFDDGTTGPAIVLTINTADGDTTTQSVVAIPASSLVDVYTGGSTATVSVAVDSSNKITASLVFDTATLTGSEGIIVKTTNGIEASSTSVADLEAYADEAESDAVSTAKTYTDSQISTATTSLQSYADQAESDAVASAKTYTDSQISAVTTDLQAYADEAESDAVSTAKTYTDSQISSATASLQTYADTAESDAISTAEAYTDDALTWNTI